SSAKFRNSFKSGRQQAHLNLNENKKEFNDILKHYIDPHYNGSEFVALKSLAGCPSRAKGMMKTIHVAKGSNIFFRGFFPHSGGSYKDENLRIHFLCSHQNHTVDTVCNQIVDFVNDDISDTDYEINQ
ncbi:hypothetical protein ROZALSC1DRAFT_25345, partial [Rozella allomycis CSF55]